MTIIPIESLTNGKRSQLHQSISDCPFYLDLIDYKWDESVGTTIYYFEFGFKVNERNVKTYKTQHRFSELYSVYEYLCEKYGKFIKMFDMTFPGKKWFFSNSKSTVDYRYKQMKSFFSRATQVDGLINDINFMKVFTDEKCG